MKRIIHKVKENPILKDMLILLLLTLILAFPLYNKKFNVYYGDGAQNIVKSYETYKTIIQNNTIVIISDFVNGFGYSWTLFNGALSTIFLIIASLLNLSFVSGFKILLFLICFFSGLAIYKLMYEITEKREVALISCIIYITSPYFLNNLFVRHGLEELITYVFLPIFWYGLYSIVHSKGQKHYCIIGAVRFNFNK